MRNAATAVLTLLTASLAIASSGPVQTHREPVVDVYHGVRITDDYRWLEDWADPDVQAWSDMQNAYARGHLDFLPSVAEVRDRLTEIMSFASESYYDVHASGGRIFAMKNQPPREHPFLVVMPSVDEPGAARTLLDPGVLDPEGLTSVDWFVPSPDGSRVAVSLSRAGTESGDLWIVDVATGKARGPIIERVNGGTAGGSLAWDADGKGLYYTRYPRGLYYTRYPRTNEKSGDDLNFYVQVYHHTLGQDPSRDRYEIGKDFPKIAEIELKVDHDSGRVLATVQDGDGGDFAHFIRQPDGEWSRIAGFREGVKQAFFGEDDEVFLINRAGAPMGEVLRTSAASPSLKRAETVIAEGTDSIISSFWSAPSLVAAFDRLFVEYQTGGPSEVRVFGLDGVPQRGPDLLDVSSVGGMVVTDEGIVFANGSFVEPSSWRLFDPRTGETRMTALVRESPANMSPYRVVREFATSNDGTQVPVNIIIPPGVEMDGTTPCVLNGYGGYGVNIEPYMRTTNIDLLEQGVICAVANIRGGGEYGEAWHKAGNLTNKQNVFDDFQAAARHLITRNYTSSEKLCIIGGSNGGLLMGATFTQAPGLAGCVVSFVGIYDMLRVELSPNGVFNIPEFGTVKDKAQFEALHAYSPYHNVRDDAQYPPILFVTGANDPRVDPMQSRKMTARLQATATTNPVLLRTSSDSGHGGGAALSQRIEQQVDVHAFIYRHLGIEYKAR